MTAVEQRQNHNSWVVILAAGKGKRMRSKSKNKVSLEIGGKPIILRTIETLKKAGLNNILIVVGFAKGSVLSLLDSHIKTVEQKKRLGTGHALKIALSKIPKNASSILALYGDDSFLYDPQTFKNLYQKALKSNGEITFLTTQKDNPEGLGRIIRKNGKVMGIVEDKVTTDDQKKIKEVNLGGFLYKASFLRKNINKIKKSEQSREYYLTDLISVAVKQNLQVETLQLKNIKWRGINTPKELEEAQGLI